MSEHKTSLSDKYLKNKQISSHTLAIICFHFLEVVYCLITILCLIILGFMKDYSMLTMLHEIFKGCNKTADFFPLEVVCTFFKRRDTSGAEIKHLSKCILGSNVYLGPLYLITFVCLGSGATGPGTGSSQGSGTYKSFLLFLPFLAAQSLLPS